MLVRRQSLVFNSQAPSATGISAPPITDTDPRPSAPITANPTSTPLPPETTYSITSETSQTPTQQPGAATSTNAQSTTINLGTVIGACLGSFAILIVIVTLVVWHSRHSRKTIRPNNLRSERDDWNKLSDNPRDSRRSSFESKPSLPPLSLDYTTEYPPAQAKPLPSQLARVQTDAKRAVHPVHPYSSNQAVMTAGVASDESAGNPFADPRHRNKDMEADAASIYSAASNPFESVYTPPSAPVNRVDSPEGYARSPFFTPHPDSSVQGEKWGSVGKKRNVQESIALNDTDKLGSLIAALDLDSTNNSDEERADRSIHGHLGKFDH